MVCHGDTSILTCLGIVLLSITISTAVLLPEISSCSVESMSILSSQLSLGSAMSIFSLLMFERKNKTATDTMTTDIIDDIRPKIDDEESVISQV